MPKEYDLRLFDETLLTFTLEEKRNPGPCGPCDRGEIRKTQSASFGMARRQL